MTPPEKCRGGVGILRRRAYRAVTVVEVMVALFLLGLVLGPLVGMLSSSNQKANVSMYYLLAMHYADEMAQQLQRLAPHLDQLLAAARDSNTGRIPTLAEVLTDPTFLAELQAPASTFRVIRFRYAGKPLEGFLAVSPLDEHFIGRTIKVEALASDQVELLAVPPALKINLVLSWKETPDGGAKTAVFPILMGAP